MKVGTDSLLLGCFAESDDAQNILDIGTGTGLLALMMAQKSTTTIDAVEIDEAAFTEANENFRLSKWAGRLNIFHTPIQLFSSSTIQPINPHPYDLIISNPPYFDSQKNYQIADVQRSKARHDKYLLPEVLCAEVMKFLSDDGKFWLILPTKEAEEFKSAAIANGLYLAEEILIKPKPSKPENRVIMCYSKSKEEIVTLEFTLYDDDGNPTEEYYQLTKDFLLWERR